MNRAPAATLRRRPLAKRIRTSSSPLAPAERSIPAEDEAALAFLADVLAGETAWSMGEVRSLLRLQSQVARGRLGGHTAAASGAEF